MIIDARSLPGGTKIDTEVCIVGAGAAGITLAREFTSARFRVVLLESGGLEFEAETQDLYEGRLLDTTLAALTASRLRFFGGTTNHWGGWCLPYEAVDFEVRQGLPHRGWPFDKAYLDLWYRRAQEVCQIGPYEYGPVSWGIWPEQIVPPFRGPNFVCKVLQQSPTRFGSAYEADLRQAGNVAVYLHANALTFVTDEMDKQVNKLSVGSLSGNRFSISARVYVIAAGGIENARLLLTSGKPNGPGLGNQHDCVGRFFMVNLNYSGGQIIPSDPYVNLDFFSGRAGSVYTGFGARQGFVSFIGLSAETMRDLQLPGAKILWQYKFKPVADAVSAARRFAAGESSSEGTLADLAKIIGNLDGISELAVRKALFHQGLPVEALTLDCSSEQLPNWESRIFLDIERDALDIPKIVVDWRLTPDDKKKAAATLRLLGREIGRAGFGRLRSSLDGEDARWPEDLYGDEHHMGTTRMHVDPRLGVVDADCRVHGMTNLYVAGSSVFPTSGASNPTLTIVALALRLADHIKERLM